MSATRADRTAIRRTSLSRPVALALQDNLIHPGRTFFDYGCGRGDDLLRLQKMGIAVSGWDPAFFPDEERTPADVVNLGYVVNVIEEADDRLVVLAAAWALARQVLVVSARLDWEAADAAVDFQGDGIVTGRRTFQKFFTQEELRAWIERVLGRRPVAAAPGIFYVFRDEADEQSFAVSRVSRRRRAPGIEECRELVADHADLLAPLVAFFTERGRLPTPAELPTAPQLIAAFGSVARAFSLLRRATGAERWDALRAHGHADLLVYLALAAFPKRPRLGALPEALRLDIRAFFGSYKSGCAAADALLFSAGDQDSVDRACRRAPVGKLLPDALYVHHTAVAPSAAAAPGLRRLRPPARRRRRRADPRQALPPPAPRVVPRLRVVRPGRPPRPAEQHRRRPQGPPADFPRLHAVGQSPGAPPQGALRR